MTAWEAYRAAREEGRTIQRGDWLYRGSRMWHTTWEKNRTVPWQWGPADLEAEDWHLVVLAPTITDVRPTHLEALETIEHYFHSKRLTIQSWWVDTMLKGLGAAYPEMFRETGAVETEED